VLRRETWRRLWRSELPASIGAAALLVALLVITGSGTMAAHAQDHPPPGPETKVEVDDVDGFERVTKHLMCTCGCSLTVASCEAAMTCDVAKMMKEDVAERLRSGDSPDAVLTSIAEDYGEQVLAAPTKTGFNLAAWVVPPAVLALGALVLVLALTKWRRARPEHDARAESSSEPVDDDLAAFIDDEVRRRL
jgi:cytochrome c-type biogenesis protein CcmH